MHHGSPTGPAQRFRNDRVLSSKSERSPGQTSGMGSGRPLRERKRHL